MAISKVILNGETQMDVTQDTVVSEVLVTDYTATGADGVRLTGSYTPSGGSVTSVGTGTGLTGGPITSSGTIKADLTSDTELQNEAVSTSEVAGRIYPVRVDANGKLAVVVPWSNTDTTYSATNTNIGSASGWSAGSVPSLSYTSRSIPNVTDVGEVPTLSYTSRSIPNVTSVGSVPSLTITSTDCDDITAWSAGTAASASASEGVVTFSNGTAPSLSYTAKSVGSASNWDAGSTPTLGTAISADDITAWDAGETPTLGTAISADDITAWSAGTAPSLTVTSTSVTTGITASGELYGTMDYDETTGTLITNANES